ncbi:MAG: hypothetical protein NXI09_07095 [Bacteroidetes bacterium]|nr:hypothetical protein [Bacteroidota bacterium]
MNRYQELNRKETKIAVLGLNTEGIRYALDFAQRFKTTVYDETTSTASNIQDLLLSKDLDLDLSNFEIDLAHNESDLRAAGVFYLNGLSTSVMDWESIKRSASKIGKSLSVGDWVILGPHIDADLAEVVLLEIIQKSSGLKLGSGFEMCFHPSAVDMNNFNNMGNDLKMSHNLIVSEVEKILSRKRKNEGGASYISYQNLDAELTEIKNKIRQLWIPMLNNMTRETFGEFVNLSMNSGFLDAYSHLRLSNESKVNWRRFFKLVLRFGIKEELEEVLLFEQKRIAV